MAERYWVGGTGTWNSTNTANWSTSTGGAGGASVPGSSDTVWFDENSGSSTDVITLGFDTSITYLYVYLGFEAKFAANARTLNISEDMIFASAYVNFTGVQSTTFNVGSIVQFAWRPCLLLIGGSNSFEADYFTTNNSTDSSLANSLALINVDGGPTTFNARSTASTLRYVVSRGITNVGLDFTLENVINFGETTNFIMEPAAIGGQTSYANIT